MRVYHFLPLKWAIEGIQKRRLKVARINDLNDPFEMFSADVGDKRLRAGLTNARNVAHEQIGFLCFSRDWKNPVQWSHYADGHKGVCLGFEMADALLEPVHYSAKRLKMVEADFVLEEPAAKVRMTTALFTKYVHWQYEQEMRAIVNLDAPEVIREAGLHFDPFSEVGSLVSVMLGARCPVGRAEITSILGASLDGISLCKARPAFRSFEMVKQQRASLWA